MTACATAGVVAVLVVPALVVAGVIAGLVGAGLVAAGVVVVLLPEAAVSFEPVASFAAAPVPAGV